MNRLHIVLTATLCSATLHAGAALAFMPATPPQTSGFLRVQLGNGGPGGGGANGQLNGAHTFGGAPSVLNPSGANGGAQPAGAGTTTGPVGGSAASTGNVLRPNSGNPGGNGSKAAPMGANGVRKVQ